MGRHIQGTDIYECVIEFNDVALAEVCALLCLSSEIHTFISDSVSK